jgi:acetate---CoA ligase (ADP-forming)
MKKLDAFFSPKTIAIVGASPRKGKLGNVLIENIKKGCWKGKLYFVNPKYAKSQKNYFANLSEIKKPVDLVLIAIPAPFVNKVLENGAKAKPAIKNFTVISSGFKEAGKAGAALEEKLKNIADKYNLNILGPNCLGFANSAQKLNATFTDMKLQEGDIAIISQSGALAVALLDWAADKKIGFSKIISIGNKADIEESEILDFLANDKDTKTIALYLEGIKTGPRFREALEKLTPRKPVIILKTGKTAAGQKAVSSHTGSLAQDGEIVEAVFEKSNVISANNFEELQNAIYYLKSNSVPSKKEVIILTNAGGPGVMATDFIGKSKNIKLLNFTEKFKDDVKKYLPASSSVENPIDVIGDASPEKYQKTLEQISTYFPKNPVLTILTPQNQTDPEKVAQILANMKKKIPNLLACFMGGKKIKSAKVILEKNNIPNFDSPEKALAVVEKLVEYIRDINFRKFQKFNSWKNVKRETMLKNTLTNNRKMLFWSETEKIFGNHGVKLTKSIAVENINQLKSKKLSFPCALKTDDPNIVHRLEKNAVILDIHNQSELNKSLEKMKRATGAARFIVQPIADPGLELIIGMKRDPTFGPVILCGWGGSFTEIFKDKVLLIPPFNKKEIERKLGQLAIFPILKGFRGKNSYNLREIIQIIAATTEISAENPEIREIDINPLVVYNNGKTGRILDAKIFLQ